MQYILIDCENVQPADFCGLAERDVQIRVFLGAGQTSVPAGMAAAIQPFGKAAEYHRIARPGKNALDFHLAYHLGRLAAQNPAASFRVISKDRGFDPWIDQLRAEGIDCRRLESIAGIAPDNGKPGSADPDLTEAIAASLSAQTTPKPASLRSLRGSIKRRLGRLGKKLDAGQIDPIIESLAARGVLAICEGMVEYRPELEARRTAVQGIERFT